MSYASFGELAAANGWSVERQHEELVASHYDLYKEVNGVRPRWYNYDEMSVADLVKEIESLSSELALQCARDAWDSDETLTLNLDALADQLQPFFDAGAPDQETAVRWLEQATR
jgi:hypothetical protein